MALASKLEDRVIKAISRAEPGIGRGEQMAFGNELDTCFIRALSTAKGRDWDILAS